MRWARPMQPMLAHIYARAVQIYLFICKSAGMSCVIALHDTGIGRANIATPSETIHFDRCDVCLFMHVYILLCARPVVRLSRQYKHNVILIIRNVIVFFLCYQISYTIQQLIVTERSLEFKVLA